MSEFIGYRCSLCGTEYSPSQVTYTCPKDGGNLDVVLDYAGIRQRYEINDITSRSDTSLWRYLPLLPVKDPGYERTPLRNAGWTPTYRADRLAEPLGLRNLWIKDDGRNPTASYKDRASSVVVARALEIGAEVTVTASTGNAGAALAGMAAAVGHKAVIFAPKTAPQAKIAQLLVFGAQVILVDGNYDQAFDLTLQAAEEFGWYCRNTGYNPFTVEGKKTGAFEIWENVLVEISKKYAPLTIFVSVGDGNIISGLHKGFKDLQMLGWLDQMPHLIGVQSDKSAAVANAFFAGGEDIQPVQATTIADSISVDLPRDGVRAVRAARETGGEYLTVSDDEIISSIREMGQIGVFAEPAGAAAYAGMRKVVRDGKLDADDPVLVLNTGNGLKDVRAALKSITEAPIIEPTMPALKKHLGI